jgi:hypothetical protein
MVAPASKLMEREREDARWVIERGVRERESQRRRMIRSGSWPVWKLAGRTLLSHPECPGSLSFFFTTDGRSI